MKKQLQAIAFLAAMLIPWFSSAQTNGATANPTGSATVKEQMDPSAPAVDPQPVTTTTPLDYNDITIGTSRGATLGMAFPLHTRDKYQLYEQIIYRSDLGTGKRVISSISFRVLSPITRSSVAIYLQKTTQNRFSGASDYINLSSISNQVYSGSFNFTTGWNTVYFNTGNFVLDDNSNLLIIIDDNSGTQDNTGDFIRFGSSFYHDNESGYPIITRESNTFNINPTDIGACTSSNSQSSYAYYIPEMKLGSHPIAPLPYQQDFDNHSGTYGAPMGWRVETPSNSKNRWQFDPISSGSDDHSAHLVPNSSGTTYSHLLSPWFEKPQGADSITISIYCRNSGSSTSAFLDIYTVPTYSSNYSLTSYYRGSIDVSSGSWHRVTIPVNGFSHVPFRFALSTNNPYDIRIDDIIIEGVRNRSGRFDLTPTQPYSENFENVVSFRALGWTNTNCSPSELKWNIVNSVSRYTSLSPHSGNNMAYLYRGTRAQDLSWLESPLFRVMKSDFDDNDTLVIDFWYANPNWGTDRDTLGVYLGYNYYVTLINEINESHTGWTHYRTSIAKSDLDNSSSINRTSTYYEFRLEFLGKPNYGYGIFLDDVSLSIKKMYTVTATPSIAGRGTVSGSGLYADGSVVSVSATPATGYHFRSWSDGSTYNPHTFTINEDRDIQAYFDANQYTITANSANATRGSVTGGGTYSYNSSATLTAVPNTGYHFVRWNDNVFTNPRTITVTGNRTLTAVFEPNTYTLTVRSSDSNMGYVTKDGSAFTSGVFAYNTQVTLTAIPYTHYSIYRWSTDGNFASLSTSITINLTSDTTITAFFGPSSPYVITSSNAYNEDFENAGMPDDHGWWNSSDYTLRWTINGSQPHSGQRSVYLFEPRYSEDIGLLISPVFHITRSNIDNNDSVIFSFWYRNPLWDVDYDSMNLSVSFLNTNPVNATSCTPIDLPSNEFYTNHESWTQHQISWSKSTLDSYYPGVSPTNYTSRPYYECEFHFMGSPNYGNGFFIDDVAVRIKKMYSIQASANYASRGTVTGSGLYEHYHTATLQATPNSGYHFVRWSDGNTSNPRIINDTLDRTYTAIFESNAHTLTVVSSDPAKGHINKNGSTFTTGTFSDGTSITLTAVPNQNYQINRWSTGATTSSITFNLTSDTTITAFFGPANPYVITPSNAYAEGFENAELITDLGWDCSYYTPSFLKWTLSRYGDYHWDSNPHSGSQVAYLFRNGHHDHDGAWFDSPFFKIAKNDLDNNDSVIIDFWYANPNWDGDYDSLYISLETTNEHLWFPQNYTFFTNHDSWTHHTICVSKSDFDSDITFGVDPDYYKFRLTFKGMPDFGHGLYLDDISVSIKKMYAIQAVPNYADRGVVTGAGNYAMNATATLSATPDNGYRFVRWSDGNTSNPRAVTVTADRTYTAIFEEAPTCGIAVADLPYTENFDSYTTSTTAKTGVKPTCWTLAHKYVSMTAEYEPMLYYSASSAHSGNYSLLLNKKALYAMPRYEGNVRDLKMSFYVKQSNTSYQLQVGVMSDLSDPASFVLIDVINVSNTSVSAAEVDFSAYTGNGKYIAFKNTNADASSVWGCNYIDDIRLEMRPADPEPEPTCGIAVADLPYTENFDSYTTSTTAKTGVEPDCWTLAHKYVTMTAEYEPMLYYGASSAHSGNYSLLLNKKALYAMPRYEGNVSDLKMSFYVKQSNTSYQLQVGVMSDLNNQATFVPVATINNSNTSVVAAEVNFASYTGNGKYIAFKNTNASASSEWGCNYIDDIRLEMRPSEPEPTCGIAVADLPYTENFDSYTTSTTAKTGVEPTCWTLAHKYVTMTAEYEPMLYYGASSAHSGNYSLLLNKKALYAMPRYEGNVRDLKMSFYVKQSNTSYQLQVGVMSDLSNQATFVPVATINNSNTSVVAAEVDFASYTGNGKYIAFKNTNADASSVWGCNYIDDIRLEMRAADPEPEPSCGIAVADLPYTENFDSYTTSTTAKTGVEPTCWTLAHKYVTMTAEYEPMLYYGASSAHSGNYSLLLNKKALYAMPRYEGNVRDLKMSFYVKQSNTSYQLQVGVMSDLSNQATFVPVATINNSNTSVVAAEVNFASYTGSGKYIAFKNTNADASSVWGCNYIDDIRLEMRPADPEPEFTCAISVADLPYTENFDSYTTSTTAKTGVEPDCWTLVHKYVSMTAEYEPMIYYGASSAHSGNYSLLLNKKALYAMPRYEGNVSDLKMSFYVKQSNTSYQLQVGVMTDSSNQATFVPVATINNSNTNVVAAEVDFASYTGNGKFIAFKNTNADASSVWGCNYIDDIRLEMRAADPCMISSSDLPYTENFDTYTTSTTAKTGVEPDCWILAHKYVTMTAEYEPMIYYGSANAHSGNYSLLLNKKALYAMPRYEGNVRDLKMSFYVKQSSTSYQLQVGVMTDLSDPSTFTAVKTINNSNTSVVAASVNFSSYTGSGKYIVFKNTNSDASSVWGCNYIDDIRLELNAAKDEPADDFMPEMRSVSVYPNPTTGLLTVEAQDLLKVEVYDFAGRKVAQVENSNSVDLSDFASGIYALRITTAYGTEVRKIVKQ